MNHKILTSIVTASIVVMSTNVLAAEGDLSGRDLVEFLEQDKNLSLLVNTTITTTAISCNRPNLLIEKIEAGVHSFAIQYECHTQNNLAQESIIFVSGDVEGNKVNIGKFSYTVKK